MAYQSDYERAVQRQNEVFRNYTAEYQRKLDLRANDASEGTASEQGSVGGVVRGSKSPLAQQWAVVHPRQPLSHRPNGTSTLHESHDLYHFSGESIKPEPGHSSIAPNALRLPLSDSSVSGYSPSIQSLASSIDGRSVTSNSSSGPKICFICKKAEKRRANPLVRCACSRRWHASCHNPLITASQQHDPSWRCSLCVKRRVSGDGPSFQPARKKQKLGATSLTTQPNSLATISPPRRNSTPMASSAGDALLHKHPENKENTAPENPHILPPTMEPSDQMLLDVTPDPSLRRGENRCPIEQQDVLHPPTTTTPVHDDTENGPQTCALRLSQNERVPNLEAPGVEERQAMDLDGGPDSTGRQGQIRPIAELSIDRDYLDGDAIKLLVPDPSQSGNEITCGPISEPLSARQVEMESSASNHCRGSSRGASSGLSSPPDEEEDGFGSEDEYKESEVIKPNLSFLQMVTTAIQEAFPRTLTANEVCEAIMQKHPFFRRDVVTERKSLASVRTCLYQRGFHKIPPEPNTESQLCTWTIPRPRAMTTTVMPRGASTSQDQIDSAASEYNHDGQEELQLRLHFSLGSRVPAEESMSRDADPGTKEADADTKGRVATSDDMVGEDGDEEEVSCVQPAIHRDEMSCQDPAQDDEVARLTAQIRALESHGTAQALRIEELESSAGNWFYEEHKTPLGNNIEDTEEGVEFFNNLEDLLKAHPEYGDLSPPPASAPHLLSQKKKHFGQIRTQEQPMVAPKFTTPSEEFRSQLALPKNSVIGWARDELVYRLLAPDAEGHIQMSETLYHVGDAKGIVL